MSSSAPSSKRDLTYKELNELPIDECLVELMRRHGNLENFTEPCLIFPKRFKDYGLKEEDGYTFVDDEEYYWEKGDPDENHLCAMETIVETDSSDDSETEEAVSQESTEIKEAEFPRKKRPNNEGEDCAKPPAIPSSPKKQKT